MKWLAYVRTCTCNKCNFLYSLLGDINPLHLFVFDKKNIPRKEGHFYYGKGNLLLLLHGLLFLSSSKCSFICTIPETGQYAHHEIKDWLPSLGSLDGIFPVSSKGSFICTIPETGPYIPQPLLHQLWSTGWKITVFIKILILFSYLSHFVFDKKKYVPMLI